MNMSTTPPLIFSLPLNRDVPPPLMEIPLLQEVPEGSLLQVSPLTSSARDLIVDRVLLGDGTVCEEVARYSDEETRKDWVNHVRSNGLITVRTPRTLGVGDELHLECSFGALDYSRGDKPKRYTNEPTRPYFAWMDWSYTLNQVEACSPDVPKHPVGPEVRLRFLPGKAEHMHAVWKADGRLLIRYFDSCFNPVKRETPSLKVDDLKADPSRALLGRGVEVEGEHTPDKRFTVKEPDGFTAVSNARPFTRDGQKICFGEIHWHTELSCDGTRPLRDALLSARDDIGLDFAGPGDHIWDNGVFGEDATPEMQAEALRECDDPGHFAILPGAEFSCGIGHANYYCDSIENYLEVCKRLPEARDTSTANRASQYRWDVLTGALIPGHTFLVPHHSNTNSFEREGVVSQKTGRPFWNAMTLPAGEERPHVRLMEIYQARGSFEDEVVDPHWRILSGGYGASARSALMKGYRIGFTGGTDNHNGWPSRNNHGGMIDGFTAVITDAIDTPSIWEALSLRRCYATTGARIICDVTLNGRPIGSELKLAPDASRRMRIRIYGTAPLETVEVVSAGIVLDRIPVVEGSPDLETEWEDTRPGRPLDGVYYYLRIRQVDGNIAWLSPFWIDTAE